MEEVLIFANPIAGRGMGSVIARRLERRLVDDGYRVSVLLDRPDQLPADRPADAARAAIVIGGDGTLRSVAQRLVEWHPSHPIAVLPVPLGTANLMGRHLGIRWDDRDLADHVSIAVARRRIVPFDVGRANGRLFLLMAGIGFDAQIIHEMERMRSGPIHLGSYLLPTVSAMSNYIFQPMSVIADDRNVFPPAPAVAFVGNVSEYGTGFPVLRLARPDDGLLDVCILPCRSHADLTRWALLAAAGEHLEGEGAVYLTAKRVRVTSVAVLPLQLDGDAAGHTPVDIDLLPIKLPFIVP